MATEPTTNTLQTAKFGGGGGGALGFMLTFVFLISLAPLVLGFANGHETPLMFSGMFRAGVSLGCLGFLLIAYPKQLLNGNTWSKVWELIKQPASGGLILLAVFGNFDYALFAWSVNFVDIAVAAILFETWPVFTIIFMALLFKEEKRYRKITLPTMMLVSLSLAGFILAISSQSTELVLSNTFSGRVLTGVGLIFFSIIAGTLFTFGIKWGSNLSEFLPGRTDSNRLELCGAVIALFIASSVSALTNSSIGLIFFSESVSFTKSAVTIFGTSFSAPLIAIIGGALTQALGGAALRKANLSTDNLGINAIAYAIPVLSLVWLFSFSLADVARLDLLVIGTTAIIIANLLINVDLEVRWRVRWGFKALLISLVITGALVYMRDAIFASLDIAQWNWGDSGYFESIGLAATIFTLILAFRVARMVTRTSDENNRVFSTFRKLDFLSYRGVIDPGVLIFLRNIADTDNDKELKENYTRIREDIYKARKKLLKDPASTDPELQVLLNNAEADLDILVHSRQVEVVPGERFGLWIFAAITIALSIGTRPPVDGGWPRLMVDLFAMLISAVIIFLMVNVGDLQREREERRFGDVLKDGNYLIWFPDPGANTSRLLHYSDQWIYMAIGGVIILTFAVLLAYKWLG